MHYTMTAAETERFARQDPTLIPAVQAHIATLAVPACNVYTAHGALAWVYVLEGMLASGDVAHHRRRLSGAARRRTTHA